MAGRRQEAMKKPRRNTSRKVPARRSGTAPRTPTDCLLADVRGLIEAARQHVAQAVNSGLITLYWHIGKRIRQEILGEERAAYGEQIVYALSRQLAAEYGRGFDRRNLFHMVRFADVFPDEQIVYALRTQLTWTHFRGLIAIEDPLKREFYAEMCRSERWSTRTLQDQIKRMVYERTAVSKKPEEVIRVELAAIRDEARGPQAGFSVTIDVPRSRQRDQTQNCLPKRGSTWRRNRGRECRSNT
jgi:hypothetical protein